MPVTNVREDVEWGYTPLGYFAPDERLGGVAGLQAARRRLPRARDRRHRRRGLRARPPRVRLQPRLRRDGRAEPDDGRRSRASSSRPARDGLPQAVHARLLPRGEPPLAGRVPRRRVPLRLRAGHVRRRSRRAGLRRARLPDVPALDARSRSSRATAGARRSSSAPSTSPTRSGSSRRRTRTPPGRTGCSTAPARWRRGCRDRGARPSARPGVPRLPDRVPRPERRLHDAGRAVPVRRVARPPRGSSTSSARAVPATCWASPTATARASTRSSRT